MESVFQEREQALPVLEGQVLKEADTITNRRNLNITRIAEEVSERSVLAVF